jgi:hypothetical protein
VTYLDLYLLATACLLFLRLRWGTMRDDQT